MFYSKKTIISLVDGLAFGGGLGIAMASSDLVLTNKSLLSLPETAIGFIPDIGASYYLNHLVSDQLGLFLSLTCSKLNGIDSFFAGFSKNFIPELTSPIKSRIFEEGLPAIQRYSQIPDSTKSILLSQLPLINQCFDLNFDIETIVNRLSTIHSP